MHKSIAIIPARGGSQRLPKKNIKLFNDRPMIAYSIKAALDSKLFSRVIVSTDSEEIADIAKKFSAEVPFIRPKELSDNFTPIAEVLSHGLKWLQNEYKENYDHACLILATAPMIQKSHLQKSFEILMKNPDCTAVVPVTTFPYPILRALKLTENSRLEWCWPEHEMTRSNDLPEAFHDVGQFYWVNCSSFLITNRLLSPKSIGFPIPRHFVQDIDNAEDWTRAEYMYQAMKKGGEIEY